MVIVGISGAIGSGKSTLASMLTDLDIAHSAHLETSTVIIELAEIFNGALGQRIEQTTADVVPRANAAIGALLPHLSQFAERPISLGELAIQPAEAALKPIWYDKLFEYLQQVAKQPALLKTHITPANKSDYRALLQWIGGYFLYKLDDPLLWYKELHRRIDAMPTAISFVALTAPRQPAEAEYVQSLGGKVILIERPALKSDRSDVTERRVSEIVPDITVVNDGSLGQLYTCAQALRADLERSKTKQIYHSTNFVRPEKP